MTVFRNRQCSRCYAISSTKRSNTPSPCLAFAMFETVVKNGGEVEPPSAQFLHDGPQGFCSRIPPSNLNCIRNCIFKHYYRKRRNEKMFQVTINGRLHSITDEVDCVVFTNGHTKSSRDDVVCAVFVAPPAVLHDLDPLQDKLSYLVFLRLIYSILLLSIKVKRWSIGRRGNCFISFSSVIKVSPSRACAVLDLYLGWRCLDEALASLEICFDRPWTYGWVNRTIRAGYSGSCNLFAVSVKSSFLFWGFHSSHDKHLESCHVVTARENNRIKTDNAQFRSKAIRASGGLVGKWQHFPDHIR